MSAAGSAEALLARLLRRAESDLRLLHLPELLSEGRLPLRQILHFGLRRGQGGYFRLQQRDGAGAVILALVELPLQAGLRLGKGDFFFTGGNEGIDAPLQIGVSVDGHAAGGDEGAALVHALGHTQQRFAAAQSVQTTGGGVRSGVGAGKHTHGAVGALGAAAQGQHILADGKLQPALHRAAIPGLKAIFIRQFAPLAGVQPVEHGQQKAGPGGLAALVGGADHVQPRLQGQLRLIQFSIGGIRLKDPQDHPAFAYL